MIKLKRYEKNPILEPKKENKWESEAVFNCAAIRDADLFHLIYRAMGEDNISRLGYAVSKNGFNFFRLDKPVFQPENESEKLGCEDPRIVKIEDTFYMNYTAYSKTAVRVALASTKNFIDWKRYGVIIDDINSKDAALFPEKINGKYVMLHRPMIPGEPLQIWIAYSDDLVHWNRHKSIIDLKLESWTSRAIGTAAAPIKTEQGWLLIFHGVDNRAMYRLGIALLDKNDPSCVLRRQKKPILEPEKEYEQRGKRDNVVFSCGACEIDKLFYVYYGAADNIIGVATMDKSFWR